MRRLISSVICPSPMMSCSRTTRRRRTAVRSRPVTGQELVQLLRPRRCLPRTRLPAGPTSTMLPTASRVTYSPRQCRPRAPANAPTTRTTPLFFLGCARADGRTLVLVPRRLGRSPIFATSEPSIPGLVSPSQKLRLGFVSQTIARSRPSQEERGFRKIFG
jgi:hypothetical protein